MTRWHPTAALRRALVLAGLGLTYAVVLGEPVVAVLVTPFVLASGLALVRRPTAEPRARVEIRNRVLHEGQGTVNELVVDEAGDVEQVVRSAVPSAYVAAHPARGCVGGLLGETDALRLELSPRRWGRVDLGEEQIALTTAWGGYRWGPVTLSGRQLSVLPTRAPFDSHAEAPQPVGLVGGYRSRRPGSGTELAGIRPFVPGDRLRRVNWRISLRSRTLHVVDALAETDTGVLIVVDALADLGRSGGIGGRASSLDLTVRAAAALAEHHVRRGDRVALRVIGGPGRYVGAGTGTRHLRIVLQALADVRPGLPRDLPEHGLSLRVSAGTEVLILSTLLQPAMVNTAATLTRRGLPVLVIDTLPHLGPDQVGPGLEDAAEATGSRREVAALAWRMRRAERDLLLERLARTGCPVVPWRGPGTLDDVLRRLARRAQLPRVVAR